MVTYSRSLLRPNAVQTYLLTIIKKKNYRILILYNRISGLMDFFLL